MKIKKRKITALLLIALLSIITAYGWYDVSDWEIAVCMNVVPPPNAGMGMSFMPTKKFVSQLTYTIQAQKQDYLDLYSDTLNYTLYTVAWYIHTTNEGGEYEIRIQNQNNNDWYSIASGTMTPNSYSGTGGFEVYEDQNHKNYDKAILTYITDSMTGYVDVEVDISVLE